MAFTLEVTVIYPDLDFISFIRPTQLNRIPYETWNCHYNEIHFFEISFIESEYCSENTNCIFKYLMLTDKPLNLFQSLQSL